jgi:hypothetical protein
MRTRAYSPVATPVASSSTLTFELGASIALAGGFSAWSGPCIIEDAFARAGFSLPAEWEWARSHWGQLMYQANCGIVGGTNFVFLRHYAQLALDVVLNPLYATVWAGIAGKPELNMILEQFMLSACLEFHRSNPGSPCRGIQARYLFPSSEAAFNPSYANRMGFTHLIADSKRDANVARRLEEQVAREDRDFYRHCLGLGESVSPGGQLR